MYYMILHIPSGTYLYIQDEEAGKFIPAKFQSVVNLQKVLMKSLKEWQYGELYFQHEANLVSITPASSNIIRQLSNIWKEIYLIEEFEIIKKD